MRKNMNVKLMVLILIPMLLIPLVSLVYAHFTNDISQRYRIHVAFDNMEIGSYKVLSPWDDDLIKKELHDNTLAIQTRIFPGWFVWIGLVLHNSGETPYTISTPAYDVYDSSNLWQYFIHTEYFYGPYDKGEFATADPKVWGGIKWWQLPPEAEPAELPAIVDPCHKLILWIKLKFEPPTSWYQNEADHDCKIKISVSVPCTPPIEEIKCWTWP